MGPPWRARQGADGAARKRGAVGLPELESRLSRRKRTGSTGGARLSAGAGEGVPTGPGWGMSWAGAGGGFGPREKKKKERGRWAGLKTRKREKSWFSIFEKIQTHSI